MGSVTTTQSRFVAGESLIGFGTGYSFAGMDSDRGGGTASRFTGSVSARSTAGSASFI
jgi:hypothetical protein